jgi:hypothetical protein
LSIAKRGVYCATCSQTSAAVTFARADKMPGSRFFARPSRTIRVKLSPKLKL